MGWFSEGWFGGLSDYLWNFAKIKTEVRRLTGRPQTNQLGESDLEFYVNEYYRNRLPLELRPEILNTFYSDMTTAGVDFIYLPDSVMTIDGPVTFDGYPAALITDPKVFYGLFSQDTEWEESRPSHILLDSRQVFMRPPPDAAYQFQAWSMQKPTAFSLETDVPLRDEWGKLIAVGTAIDICQGDQERLAILVPLYKKLRNSSQTPDLMQTTPTRAAGRW